LKFKVYKNTYYEKNEIVKKEKTPELTDEAYKILKEYVKKNKGIEPQPEENLELEIGMDSLDIVEFFAFIENMRRENGLHYLDNWGQTTVSCLLNLKDYVDKVEIIASGGVRNPLDIVKSLVLGARAVGISKIILELAVKYEVEKVIEILESWKNECRMIMCALNARNIRELRNVKYVLYGKTLEFAIQQK